MKTLLVALSLPFLALAGSLAHEPAAERLPTASPGPHPVVLELFTSQGCSSCPAADALANRLAQEPGLVVITRPVTYWDRLGWKDTLARPENSALQRSYAARRRDRSGVYTPQVVVDGEAVTVGSREREVRQLAAAAGKRPHPELRIVHAPGGGWNAQLSGEGRGELALVALDAHESVAIGRGENGGRRVTYANVYLGEQALGRWQGGRQDFAIPAAALHSGKADRFALVLRREEEGPILAGRILPL